MNKKILFICIIPILIIIHQYARLTHLSIDELKWADAYMQGDSVYFFSNDGEQDYLIVKEKHIWNSLFPFWWPFESDYDALIGFHYILVHQGDSLDGFFYVVKYSKFCPAKFDVSIVNTSLHQKIPYNIMYQNDNMIFSDSIIFINDTPAKNIEGAKGLYIKTFLWDRTKGLVEYEFNNGSVYHRLQ